MRHHGELSGARLEGVARTAPGYRMVLAGAYPALVQAAGGGVSGELYRVTPDQLARLDRFEECPERYQREQIELSDGSMAVAYVMQPEQAERYPWLPDGPWRESQSDPTLAGVGRGRD
jgi:gamma-glutamylcyclotransferase (GGCT)/AIG2-like uncharacterized protein YtfP